MRERICQDGRSQKTYKTVHKGQKDHKCETWGKEFGQLGQLKIHIKNVHKDQ